MSIVNVSKVAAAKKRPLFSANANQSDGNQTKRGTVFTRCWSGRPAPRVEPNMAIALQVQRKPGQAAVIDEAVVYCLAVMLAIPGEVRYNDNMRARIAPPIRAGGR